MTNIAAASQKKHHPSGLINYGKSADLARDYVKRMNIRCSGINQRTLNLSGGNQQKVLLSMWLANEPNILLIDEPTRGVDVGAKAEIHALLRSIVETGKGVIFVSSELPELLASCDRIAVMHEGVVMDILDNDSAISEEQIMQLASGMEAEKPA